MILGLAGRIGVMRGLVVSRKPCGQGWPSYDIELGDKFLQIDQWSMATASKLPAIFGKYRMNVRLCQKVDACAIQHNFRTTSSGSHFHVPPAGPWNTTSSVFTTHSVRCIILYHGV